MLLWGATPRAITQPGKLRHVVLGERHILGWGLVGLGAGAGCRAHLWERVFGTAFGVWLVRFHADLALGRCQRARLVRAPWAELLPRGGGCVWGIWEPGAAACGRARVKGHVVQRLPLPLHQLRHI